MITRISLVCLMFLGTLVANAQVLFQDDFANLNSWTQQDLSNAQSGDAWIHSTVGPTGGFAITPIASTTAANGFALFDSDVLCSFSQNALLISPTIDCASATNVYLQFEQNYRRFYDSTYVLVSIDNGMTWDTAIQVNAALANNDGSPTNPEKIQLSLGAIMGGQSQVKFAFQFRSDANGVAGSLPGCGYSWMIDDVLLTTQGVQNDLALATVFNPASAYSQPESQIATDTFGFFANITNKGEAPQTNVVLKASIFDYADPNAPALIWTDSTIIDVIPAGATDTSFSLGSQYVPDLPIGTYATVYELYSKDVADEDGSNNLDGWFFESSDNIFARDPNGANPQGLGYFTLGNVADYPGGWYVGCHYRMSPDIVENYVAITATTASSFNPASATNPMTLPVTMDLLLLKVNDDVDAGFDNFDNTTFNGSFGDPVGLGALTYTAANQSGTLQNVTLTDFNSGVDGVSLVAGGRYFLVMAYTDDNKKNGMFHGFAGGYDYPFQAPTSVIFVSNPDDPGSADVPQTWYLNGFGTDQSAVMRMEIVLDTKVDETPLADNALVASPNPTTDVLNVALNFEKTTNATVTLADINGKVITYENFKNVNNTTATFNVANYPAGTYIVRVATLEGTKTKKFVVVR